MTTITDETYLLTTKTLDAAMNMVKMTRSDLVPGTGQFVGWLRRLDECVPRLDGIVKFNSAGVATKIPDEWPNDPGITLAWIAGGSALDVALQFIRMTWLATCGLRPKRHGERPEFDKLPSSDPAFEKWRDEAIAELLKTFPRDTCWPVMGHTHRDHQSIAHKLHAEYETAQSLNTSQAKADSEPKATGMAWREAKDKAEEHVKALHGVFPSVKKLAEVVGCSRSTIRKAVAKSAYLKARKAEAEAGKPVREQAASDPVLELISEKDWKAVKREQRAEEEREERQHRAAQKRRQ